jgi:low affinity Fe/Cu permease
MNHAERGRAWGGQSPQPLRRRGPMQIHRQNSWFTRFTKRSARVAGRPVAFTLAVTVLVLWAASGFLFDFSDTWQLVVNTGTTIVTFLMVFLIQSTQNRDSEAIQLKLDELIRATDGAHVALLDLEELDEEELERICKEYQDLAHRARQALRAGKPDTDVPRIDPGRRRRK